ncbi:LamG domain-containing protein [Candidatus Poribacteria bacterium]|nr:LamG domain-containing protein [Candidatus Poribacteria bacterium]
MAQQRHALRIALGVAAALAIASAASADVIFLATFDADSGTTVKDAKGGSGNVVGKAATVDGKLGKAFSFDGATAIAFAKTAGLAKVKEPMTVGAWVRPTALTSWSNIVEMDGPAGSWKLGFSDAKPVWTTYRVKDHIGVGPVALNAWSHVAAVYDGAAAKLYVNGKLDAEIAGSGKINVDVADVPTLDIGWRSTSKASFFSGAMDEVFVANTAMSPADLAKVMLGLGGGSTAVEPSGKASMRWAELKDAR